MAKMAPATLRWPGPCPTTWCVLELGIELIRRRLIYLKHILKQKETSLVKNFFKTQLATLQKKDWGTTVKEDLKHLKIEVPIEEIEHIPKATYEKLIKKRRFMKSHLNIY